MRTRPVYLGGNTQHGALRCDKRKLCLGQASENVTLKTRLIGIMRTTSRLIIYLSWVLTPFCLQHIEQ